MALASLSLVVAVVSLFPCIALQPLQSRAALSTQFDGKVCATLIDYSTHYSVKARVGSKTFEVIPDTGSQTVIVPSCDCAKDGGGCPKSDECVPVDSSFSANSIPMSFGTGTLIGHKGTATISVGDTEPIEATIEGGVLLMTDRSRLQVSGSFEGILGLGVPDAYPQDKKEGLSEFLKEANVNRFSICFFGAAMGENGGVLSFEATELGQVVPNVGQEHWAADLRGISVGGTSSPVLFCTDLAEGQQTPCAAIPDSGTTFLLGPESRVLQLMAAICDDWERCKGDSSEEDYTKAARVVQLMRDCDKWDDSELPPVYIRFGAGHGKEEVLTLPGHSYVFKPEGPGCEIAFDFLEYKTKESGDIWVMGQPLFNQYKVTFEIGDDQHKIGFSSSPCGACESGFHREQLDSVRELRRPRRELHGQKRRPSFDASRPL